MKAKKSNFWNPLNLSVVAFGICIILLIGALVIEQIDFEPMIGPYIWRIVFFDPSTIVGPLVLLTISILIALILKHLFKYRR